MANGNELNQLMNTTVPNIVNAAIARRDRREELQYVREHQAERENVLDTRYAEEQLKNQERYDVSIAMQRENTDVNRYSAVSNRVLKTIGEDSSIGEVNDAINFVKENFVGSENDFIGGDSKLVLAHLEKMKDVVNTRDEGIKFVENIMERSIDSADGNRQSFTNKEDFEGLMSTISENIDKVSSRGLTSIKKQMEENRDILLTQRSIRNFLLSKEIGDIGEEKASLKDDFQMSKDFVDKNPNASVLLTHINELDKAGDWKGAYETMRFVAANINKNNAEARKEMKAKADELKDEAYNDAKAMYTKAMDYVPKAPKMTFTKDASPNTAKAGIGQTMFDILTGDKIQIESEFPEPIKNYMNDIKKNKDVISQSELEEMYKTFAEMTQHYYNSDRKNFKSGTDYRRNNLFTKGLNTPRAKQMESLVMTMKHVDRWSRIEANGDESVNQGYLDIIDKYTNDEEATNTNANENSGVNGYTKAQLDSMTNVGFDEFEAMRK